MDNRIIGTRSRETIMRKLFQISGSGFKVNEDKKMEVVSKVERCTKEIVKDS